MTKFFKGKGTKKEAKPVPRETAEIHKEYAEVKAKAGEAQYLVYAYSKEVERLNQVLAGLNYEADARKTLDAAKGETNEQPRG